MQAQEQKLNVIDTIVTCYCGNTEDNHRFRHIFDPRISIDVCEDVDEKRMFRVDATQWKLLKKEGRCDVPQCGAAKSLHWNGEKEEEKKTSVIKHLFSPAGAYEYRSVSFVIPDDTPCNSCGIVFADHKVRHHFSARVVVLNKGEHDKVEITHRSGVPIEVHVD
jgi:hypothetical protein